MSASFGCYLGNTNFSIAINKDGKTEVLANDAGDRCTPSMVAFVDEEMSVGPAAKQGRLRHSDSTISHVKNLLTQKNSEIANTPCTCKILTEGGLKFEIENNKTRHYTPEDIIVFFFQFMNDIAKRSLHDDNIHDAVISVPWNFSEELKAILKNSANKAGFRIMRMISEPAAACLAYGIGQESNNSSNLVLVFRVGGTSTTVSVVKVIAGIYKILANKHRDDLGGDAISDCLVEHCCDEFKRQFKVDIRDNKRAKGKLWNASESCKQGLSLLNTVQCCAESVHEGIDLSLNVSRARFESLIGSTLQQCMDTIESALNECSITKEEINKVVLVGGSTKVSRLQQMLKEQFSNAEVLFSLPPDEVLSLGAAEQAALIQGKEENENGLSEAFVLSRTIYLKTEASNAACFYPVLKEGTPIPTKWQQTFHVPKGQSSILLSVYEEVDNGKAVPLAKVQMKDVENAQLVVKFQIRNDFSLHITCTNKESDKTESVIVEPSVEIR